jgi:large subunit ribosomal protein L21
MAIVPASTDGVRPVRSSLSPIEPDQRSDPSPMYAVIRTGGKQYKVAKDDVIVVETLAAEAGATVTLDEVLLVADGAATTVGTPTVSGAEVTATVVEHKKGDKVLIFKKRRRHNYRRKIGHRQPLTVLKITGISAGK